ncbi:metal-dependent hydrolase [Paracidovorax avenae]|uniref:M48 family metallopeptidase n=1 Tax=Paracidovorax avenae TaxID=80867 RepID=UPI000D156D56|nr:MULTISPECIES: SprT family zinc-dependent metalloprotease [Comamonadaceae]AVS78992.1 metal-dependent hydrolase [Paracidovorax avenae]AVS82502.1 metal-dependent hydrolase [Paracidovorax avenae]AVT07223.1 metal-dependent hydrolase [Paracidovorax avenae]AVT17800.1 metal-dependent hydrolase [Paracidovorax avenae]MDA8448114.1 M48 family metallopeptidase [Acidovorax sp. GBBC 3297]
MQRLVQLALDFFGGDGGAAPPVSPRGVPSNAAPLGAGDPAEAGGRDNVLRGPMEFRHPGANRELLLGDVLVAYALQRSRRRTIGFTVGADGLSVRAPGWVSLANVDASVREKSAWILRKLGEAQERQRRQADARIAWGDGAVLPYMGEPIAIVLDPAHGFRGQGGALVPGPDGALALHVGLPRAATPEQVRDAVQAWLMRDARRHFTARLDHFAPLLGVQWRTLRLSSAHTRWGSARADGSIRLNWRLLHYRPAIIDYVVAHELSHLRHMDHSPRFWDTVATVVPDYAALRDRLRDDPAPQWD